MNRYVYLCCIALLFLLGCDSTDNEPEEPAIVFGVSIEGIELGFTNTEVLEVLGDPFEARISSGSNLLTYRYGNDDPGASDYSIFIAFPEAFDNRVAGISVLNHYKGTAEGGLGIGSPRQEIIQRLGQPDTSLVYLDWGTGPSPAQGDNYLTEMGQVVTTVAYDTNHRVTFISIGLVTLEAYQNVNTP